MRRQLASIAIAAVLVVGGAVTAPVTLARLTDQDTSTISFSTDTLAPPTSLAATGTTSASLTWTPSNDAYASGYEVLRSTTSGSGPTTQDTAPSPPANGADRKDVANVA